MHREKVCFLIKEHRLPPFMSEKIRTSSSHKHRVCADAPPSSGAWRELSASATFYFLLITGEDLSVKFQPTGYWFSTDWVLVFNRLGTGFQPTGYWFSTDWVLDAHSTLLLFLR